MCVSPQSPLFDRSMETLVECAAAVNRGATDPQVFFQYARALWNVRDLDGTMAALDRAITGSPPLSKADLSLAYSARSICHHQLRHPEQATADANAALEADPRPHVYTLRAITLMVQGRLDEAIADAEEGVRLDPRDWETRAFRGLIHLERHEYAAAIEDFTWVIEDGRCEKYASELYLGRARAYLALGDPCAAEADCTVGIDEDYHEQSHWPFIVRSRAAQAQTAYLIRAEARLALGQLPRALGDCYWAASIAPGDPAVYDLRSRIFYELHNLPEAVNDTIRAAHLRKSSAPEPEQFAPSLEPMLAATLG